MKKTDVSSPVPLKKRRKSNPVSPTATKKVVVTTRKSVAVKMKKTPKGGTTPKQSPKISVNAKKIDNEHLKKKVPPKKRLLKEVEQSPKRNLKLSAKPQNVQNEPETVKEVKKLKTASRTNKLENKRKSEVILKKNTKIVESPKKIVVESPKKIAVKKSKSTMKTRMDAVNGLLLGAQKSKPLNKKVVKIKTKPKKVAKVEKKDKGGNSTDESTTSDDLTLNVLRQKRVVKPEEKKSASFKLKRSPKVPSTNKLVKSKKKNKKLVVVKKEDADLDGSSKASRKLKLYSWWTGPRRHRVASLNALAKVHCLYENESRGALYDSMKTSPVADSTSTSNSDLEPLMDEVAPSTRTLRSAPGLRGVGKHWDMHDETSSSSSASSVDEQISFEPSREKSPTPPKITEKNLQENKKSPSPPRKSETSDSQEDMPIKKKPPTETRKRRNRTELIMDLKDMVVRKRMASLNASAILAASYSVEKKSPKSFKSEESSETEDTDTSPTYGAGINLKDLKCRPNYGASDSSVVQEKKDVIEVHASPNKKVAVILNQDTDVTITGVYVNSTTRSTHHEGYCSIAGMQYRISATSHTQTAATAVATETLLHSTTAQATAANENPSANVSEQPPCKSYTPLGALSSMQPPGLQSQSAPASASATSPPMSARRHGCSSAFTAPVAYGPIQHPEQQPPPAYIHGYYQPAGPLITSTHQSHPQPPPAPIQSQPPIPFGKLASLSSADVSLSPTPPPQSQPPSSSSVTVNQAPSSSTGTGDSSDNEVIITSSTSAAEQLPPQHTYRYAPAPPPAAPAQYPHAPAYSYSYPPPPAQYYQQQQQQHFHHELCYPNTSYPPSYLHPKAYATTFRRYLPAPQSATQYYPGQDLYSASTPSANTQNTQVVTVSGGGYQPPGATVPPPPTLVESYPPPPPAIVESYPPPPPHYYAAYGTGPMAPPTCYSHSPPTRNLAFIDAAYQSCPCPMQSCPKNVHTGPLIGDGKRSSVNSAITNDSLPTSMSVLMPMPLPPVALALPLEPASVAGPPSPARGSAGMPPPPSPAGATYQPASKWTGADSIHTVLEPKCSIVRSKARVGKTMVRNNIISNAAQPQHGMLLMCHNTTTVPTGVKREVESPEDVTLGTKPVEKIEPPPNENESIVQQNKVVTTAPPLRRKRLMDLKCYYKQKQSKCKNSTLLEQKNGIVRSKARVGKTAARNNNNNNVTQAQQGMLLMCHNTAIPVGVKQEVESSEDVTLSTKPVEKTEPLLNENETIVQQMLRRKRLMDLKCYNKQKQSKCKIVPENCTPETRLDTKPVDKFELAQNQNKIVQQIKVATVRRKPLMDLKCYSKQKQSKCKLTAEDAVPLETKPVDEIELSQIQNETIVQQIKVEPFRYKPPMDLKCCHDQKQSKCKNGDLTINQLSRTTNRKHKLNTIDSDKHLLIKTPKITLRSTKQQQQQELSLLKPLQTKKQKLQANNNIERTIESVVTCAKPSIRTALKEQSKKLKVLKTERSVKSVNNCKKQSASNKSVDVASALAPLPAPVSRVSRKSLSRLPRWSNGWSWTGEPFHAKVFLNCDESPVIRKCFPSMRHAEGDVIMPRDCVLLKAGPRRTDLPFVAKVAALWEDDDGEMMMSLLWYYRPEHTEQGRRISDQLDEVFASRHKDTNSVACIEDKCYVLTFHEYCRYRKVMRRIEEHVEHLDQVVPQPEGGLYFRKHRQPPTPHIVASDLVFFCRQVYDFRQKRIVKNPT